MGLYNVEPDATRKGSYYDYAVAWGESPTHPWLLANTKAGVMSTDANNQACGQTYIDLYKIDPQPIRIQEIKANLDDMVTNGTSNVWCDRRHPDVHAGVCQDGGAAERHQVLRCHVEPLQ